MATATKITSCATTECAFNNGGCTALAITVSGGDKATCATFTTLDARSTGPAEAAVGACHRLECAHNKDLQCTNAAIEIVGDAATCANYEVA